MSELANARSPALFGFENPVGLFRWAARSRPSLATPALSKPADSVARGSVVLGSCADAIPAPAPAANTAPASATTILRDRLIPIPSLPLGSSDSHYILI